MTSEMCKNSAKLKKFYFEFYLVKTKHQNLIYLSCIIDYIPVNKIMDAFYPLMEIECSTPQLVVRFILITTSLGVEHSLFIRG